VNNVIGTDALLSRVMTGVEWLMYGDGEHAFDGLTVEEENLALIISGRRIRALAILDTGTREAVTIEVDTSLPRAASFACWIGSSPNAVFRRRSSRQRTGTDEPPARSFER
jgi:hypothetical protein